MTQHTAFADPKDLEALVAAAGKLGYEIVDVAGFLEMVDGFAKQQTEALTHLKSNATALHASAGRANSVGQDLAQAAERAAPVIEESVADVKRSNLSSQEVASWVRQFSDKTGSVEETLSAVKKNNTQIAQIARQVNTLAINAKIEAARAGVAGQGFAVVAESINELSQQTSTAAVQISDNVDKISTWFFDLASEADEVATNATEVLERAERNDESLSQIKELVQKSHGLSRGIVDEISTMQGALNSFLPNIEEMDQAAGETTKGVAEATKRTTRLIDVAERIVQSTAALGGTGNDDIFVSRVQQDAAEISRRFLNAVETGMISPEGMFDQNYRPIAGTNPEQVTTAFTDLTDRVLPEITEAVLAMDPKIVFCAAVDRNGYLPTHNKKFSQPQGDDPVWNTANSRNRRMFNDRVGLKAGQNTEPFLLQVYRRDMGGGQFIMMKDISAPIFVGDRHWGGLRLAVKY